MPPRPWSSERADLRTGSIALAERKAWLRARIKVAGGAVAKIVSQLFLMEGVRYLERLFRQRVEASARTREQDDRPHGPP